MKWQPFAVGVLTATTAPMVVHASVFLTVQQAQQQMFGQAAMQQVMLSLKEDQQKILKKASGIYHPFTANQVYKVAGGGWFVVDQVLGKHEMITYAVGLHADGSVKQIEILEYRETYGGEVRNPNWRSQFIGKTAADPLKLNQDIKNISGATLSSRHLTDGVKRILALHQLSLKAL
jgi:Na+-translocating ferredoxin:NAD+ oxidoreductase RnfG subunit